MNFEYYRIFYYVAKYKNITQAAGALFSNQPNVSRIINKLEGELGCRLIVRSNRGITLTPEGQQLYEHVAIAFEHLQAGEAELKRSIGLQSGTVYIGASETALHGLLLEQLQTFHRKYPKVHVKIYNVSTRQAVQSLKNGQIDLAVVTTPADIEKPLKEIRLKAFQDILIGGTEFEFLVGKPVRLKELSEYPMIGLAQATKTYDFYEKLYLEHGQLFQPDVEVATADLILPVVKNNLGIGFISEEFAREALEKGEVVKIPLFEKIPERCICLIYDRERSLSTAARALETLLTAAAAGRQNRD
ncbi:MAG: LysR family transcriptional regulator [Lachnospiraceae bacterium]|nr:LysR family transcriptional regulator [Lachnospiraceae bacterium]